MTYATNKANARTRCVKPSLTDQSAAKETDRNIIVERYMVHGQAPGSGKQPMYGDFSNLPTSLAGFMSQARSLARLKKRLPPQLANMSQAELLALTPDKLTSILTPPEPPADKETK